MNIDMTVRLADIVMVLAVLLAPLLAVQVSEYLREGKDAKARKLSIFKTLMATRASPLAAERVQALNMVDTEFHSSKKAEREVVEAWEVYLAHLNTLQSGPDWVTRQEDLYLELLFRMAQALGYALKKSEIKRTSYFPVRFGQTEFDNLRIRAGLAELVEGKRALKITEE